MKKYLIANWKMNPETLKQAQALVATIISGIKKLKLKEVEVILCPPFPYLGVLSNKLSSSLKLGAQNCYYEKNGEYTGEVSASMLKSLGCKYVIIGHSERRHHFAEDDSIINKKLKAVFASGLTPVLAVGERSGEDIGVISKQLKGALAGINSTNIKKLLVAYEPVWAIGTGKAATPNEALAGHVIIQKILSELYSRKIAEKIPILYGGSTNHKNLAKFIFGAHMHGALVGRSSLNATEFVGMTKAFSEHKEK